MNETGTSETATDTDRFLQTVKSMVRGLGPGLEPDEDWNPVLFMDGYTEGDDRGFHIGAIDPSFMQDEESKDQLFYKVIPQLLIEVRALRCAFVSAGWSLEPKSKQFRRNPDRYLGIQPSQHPERIEVVFMVWCDEESAGGVRARIIRTDDAPPQLSRWRDMRSPENPAAMEGRVIDPMRQAIHLVHLMQTDPVAFLQEMLMNPRTEGKTGELIETILSNPDFREWANRRRRGEK